MIIILAFLCGVALDVVWTKAVQAVQTKRPIQAANMSVLLYTLTIIATILVVEQCIPAIIAYGLGNWCGTYFTVNR